MTATPMEEALEIGRELLPWVLLRAMRTEPAASAALSLFRHRERRAARYGKVRWSLR
jgi:hypothetical protein